ncbi:hypothetical protein AVEN_258989-1 [Araneus ventricosus]|uniref:Uncharacterized protein n=1 Tax=Araneus ventricosus TaxID=182803 RepID=A0A4Y2R4D0_ARAVE|nr:hypothetical protein AVEN_258989-1 [Araneus ventricosus]
MRVRSGKRESNSEPEVAVCKKLAMHLLCLKAISKEQRGVSDFRVHWDSDFESSQDKRQKFRGFSLGQNLISYTEENKHWSKLTCRVKRSLVGVVWEFGESLPVQVSSLSSDHGSK